MRIEEVLQRLQKVRRTSKGWMALCPAHADRTPSLSVSAGQRGTLLHCFAGCSFREVLQVLGINPHELFYDSQSDSKNPSMTSKKSRSHFEDEPAGLVSDAMREAEYLVLSARNIEIVRWSSEHLDGALNSIAAAYSLLELDNNGTDHRV
jgi:hypothetical protein